MTLLEISSLKPVTIDTATIITAKPNAIPNVAILTMDLENDFFSPLAPIILLAMKSSMFNRK